MKLNIGIIGYGKMGVMRHNIIKKYSSFAKVEMISDSKDLKINSDCKFVKDYREIINNPDINTVFICTPNYLNKKITLEALRKNKNVFCEKPPAVNYKDIKKIIEVEKKSKSKLMYGFNHRHHESIKLMKKLILSKKYGKILWMRGRYGKSVDKKFYNNWRSKNELSGGGILIDQGIHMLDILIFLYGTFDVIKSVSSNLYWKSDVEDNMFVIFKDSKTGVSASLHSTMTQWRHLFSLEVFLEKGYLVLNGLKTSSKSYGKETLTIAKNRSVSPAATWKDEKKINFKKDNSMQNEVKDFLLSIKNNKKIKIGNSDDALKIMRTISKIYKEAKK